MADIGLTVQSLAKDPIFVPDEVVNAGVDSYNRSERVPVIDESIDGTAGVLNAVRRVEAADA